jgi:putative membrane protein
MRIVVSVIVTMALAMASTPAFAHFVDHPATHGITWSFEPWVLVSLGVAALLYGLGVYRLYSEVGAERVLDRWRIAAFVGGMGVLFVALCSPIDTIGGELFSVHMIQHLLLMLAAPPLLVWSRPAIAFVWAFSPAWRKRIGRFWTGARLGSLFAFLMRPMVVWVFFVGSFVFWHLPGPYSWALYNDFIHALEHASFFLTSLAFWTLVIEPSGQRRLGYASALLYVAVTAVLCGLPGALMILAPRAFYPEHAAGAAAWGLTLMEDQQLAGLIMWIPAGAIYIGAAAWLFVRMMHDSGRRIMRLPDSTVVLIAILLLPLLLGGCRDAAQASNTSFGGNPKRGAALIQKFGCGACHTIPGIDDAKGLVGPPLDHMGSRVYLAGVLRNTPDNMMEWLRNPQQVVPNNAMPDVGLNEKQARDITAYLETLE